MTAQVGYDQREAAAREHAWAYERGLRTLVRGGQVQDPRFREQLRVTMSSVRVIQVITSSGDVR